MLTPIFFIRDLTKYSATPVFCRIAPSPEPNIIINPIIPKNDPSDSANTPPKDENGCFVRIAVNITLIATFNTGLISLNDKMI